MNPKIGLNALRLHWAGHTPRQSESVPRAVASALARQATLATARGTDLQVLYNKLQHHLAHVPDQARIGHTVAGFRVGHELELIAGLLQLVNELDRILHMHIVVNG